MDEWGECQSNVLKCKPDDLLVFFTRQAFGIVLGTVVAALFLYLAWRDAAKAVIHAGGLLAATGQNTRTRLSELPAAYKALAILVTVLIALLEMFWLFWVFVMGNLVSLVIAERDTSILQFDLLDPAGTLGVLQWDKVSTIYVLVALGALFIARWYYKREYGSEFLGFVVAIPAVLGGGLAALAVAFHLVMVGLAWLFEGSTELTPQFWTYVLITVVAGAYLVLCLLALRAADFAGKVWLGDVHNPDRDALLGEGPKDRQVDIYLKAFYRTMKNNPAYTPVRLNWHTKGWQVSSVTTSNDRSSYTVKLYVTTSGRAVIVDSRGAVEKLRHRQVAQFPVDWSSPPGSY